MSLNIAHGRGLLFHQALVPAAMIDHNLTRIADLARNEEIDLAGLQEADTVGVDGINHVAKIAERGGFAWWVGGSHTKLGTMAYGTALTGVAAHVSSRTERFDTFGPGFKKGFSVSTVALKDVEVDIVSLHLDPLFGVRRKKQVTQIVERFADSDRPLIIMGDFNAQWGDGKPVTRMAEELGLTAYRPEAEDMPTFKGKRRLDWILVSEDALEFEDYRTLADEVSDHQPVVADVVLR